MPRPPAPEARISSYSVTSHNAPVTNYQHMSIFGAQAPHQGAKIGESVGSTNHFLYHQGPRLGEPGGHHHTSVHAHFAQPSLGSEGMRLSCDVMKLLSRELALLMHEGKRFEDAERQFVHEFALELQRMTNGSDFPTAADVRFSESMTLEPSLGTGVKNVLSQQSVPSYTISNHSKADSCRIAIPGAASTTTLGGQVIAMNSSIDSSCRSPRPSEGSGKSKRSRRTNISRSRYDEHERSHNCSMEVASHSVDREEIDSAKRRKEYDEKIKALLDVFTHLDTDGSGYIAREELRSALRAVDVSTARTQKLLKIADSDGSGEISFEEWKKAINTTGMRELNNSLGAFLEHSKRTLEATSEEPVTHCCMLRPNQPPRVVWDIVIVMCLVYIATALPFNLAWEDDNYNSKTKKINENIDWAIDIIFWVDIILNFRTGYLDIAGREIMGWRKVAQQYLTSWFLLDVLSSFPFDRFTPVNSQFMKLGKCGKATRVFKIMRPSRSLQKVSDVIDDFTTSFFQRCKRRGGILVTMVLLCHWLACTFKFVDGETLTNYQNVGGSMGREYLAAVYWAMTTLTTVGYGDIIPSSDAERAFSMFAMIVGGTFYGYVVGTISAIVASRDLNVSAYFDRMDQVNAWMDFHQFPRRLRSRIRRHFQSTFKERAAVSEAEIFDELSPTLREDCGEYLLKGEVTSNPLFDGLANSVVVRIQKILRQTVWEENRTITTLGESGTTMFLIIHGTVEKADGNGKTVELGPGDSFGEEVLLSLKEKYEYTTTALGPIRLHMIHEEDLLDCFSTMPDVLEQMKENAKEMM